MNEQNTQRLRVVGLETLQNELHRRVFLVSESVDIVIRDQIEMKIPGGINIPCWREKSLSCRRQHTK